jgi:fructose-bisphosphate aldolase class II
MPVTSMQEILSDAFKHRYGVAAFNIVDDVTMRAVLTAAEQMRSPLIVQVSVKTVNIWGARLIQLMFAEMASKTTVPATLHLDHCPDLAVIRECVDAGWNSVLFDGSHLDYDECLARTKEVVELAHARGVAVEGEVEPVKGVEDGIGSDEDAPVISLDRALHFVRETGIDCFAAGIGTAHGMYKGTPKIHFERAAEITAAEPIPLVLHGGTGLSPETFLRLIASGEAKVNISTQLKHTMADSYRDYLNEHPSEYNPIKLLLHVHDRLVEMAVGFIRIFGSEGRAG